MMGSYLCHKVHGFTNLLSLHRIREDFQCIFQHKVSIFQKCGALPTELRGQTGFLPAFIVVITHFKDALAITLCYSRRNESHRVPKY